MISLNFRFNYRFTLWFKFMFNFHMHKTPNQPPARPARPEPSAVCHPSAPSRPGGLPPAAPAAPAGPWAPSWTLRRASCWAKKWSTEINSSTWWPWRNYSVIAPTFCLPCRWTLALLRHSRQPYALLTSLLLIIWFGSFWLIWFDLK